MNDGIKTHAWEMFEKSGDIFSYMIYSASKSEDCRGGVSPPVG